LIERMDQASVTFRLVLASTLTAAAILATPAPAGAQSAPMEPVAETVLGHIFARGGAVIVTHSEGDKALAWWAYIAGRDRLRDRQAELERIVAERIDTTPDAAPVDFALDALIQLEADVPAALLARIVRKRPTEALVLIARGGGAGADAVLVDALSSTNGYAWYGAANLALARRPPGVAAALLTRLRVRAAVTITRHGTEMGFDGSGVGIGHCVAEEHPGMPPWPASKLAGDTSRGGVLLAPGPTPIYWTRLVSDGGSGGGCIGGTSVEAPTTEDRLTYVAALLGRPTGLSDRVHRSVRPGSTRAVRQARASLAREVRGRYAHLIGELVRANALTPAEASTLSVEVDVEVNDASAFEEELDRRERDRRPCQPCG
jgi:hypothetical protein